MAENYIEDVIAPLIAPIARARESVQVTATVDAPAGTKHFTIISNDDTVRVRLLIDDVPATAFALRSDPSASAVIPERLLAESEPDPNGWRTLWRGSGDFRGEHGLRLSAFDRIYVELTTALQHAARVRIELDTVIPSMGLCGEYFGGWMEFNAC